MKIPGFSEDRSIEFSLIPGFTFHGQSLTIFPVELIILTLILDSILLFTEIVIKPEVGFGYNLMIRSIASNSGTFTVKSQFEPSGKIGI